MSKCKVFLTATAVFVLLTSSAQALLISFSADAPSAWTPSGAVIILEVSSSEPYTITMSAESHSVFTVSSTVTNDSGFTWTSYMLTLDPIEAATFVPGSGQSTDLHTVIDHDLYTIEFKAPTEVPPGETVTFEAKIDIPDTGPYTFTLTQRAIPEPATVALLGIGALALVKRRKTN